MQSYNKSTKSKSVPLFIVICGAAIIGSAIIGTKTSQSAKIPTDTNVVDNNKELVDVDKVEVNRKLNELQYAITYALDGERTVSAGIGNILKYDSEKIKFAFMLLSYEGNNAKMKRNVNTEGIGVTGYLAVDKGYFIDYYQDLFYLGINEDVLSQLFEEKDGYLYGSTMNGLMMSTETYKINSVAKEKDDYELLIDVLNINYDDENQIKYISEKVVDYPLEAVAYQIKLNVTKTDNGYIINSLVA